MSEVEVATVATGVLYTPRHKGKLVRLLLCDTLRSHGGGEEVGGRGGMPSEDQESSPEMNDWKEGSEVVPREYL